MKINLLITCLLLVSISSLEAAVYQWSVPVNDTISQETNAHPQAFLWIPENCGQVRGVILGQHNMSEEDIFNHPNFRKNMSELGIAIVWVTPAFDMIFDFHNGAGTLVENMMKALAYKSGYGELEYVPVIPVGHSACASYPWNFAAWNPGRTLAVISEHGDAPLTNLTGSGRPNPDWVNRTIEGIPGLMVEGEYEWWEDRVQPALDYKIAHPQAPVSFLCDAGHGHFDVSDELVDYLCLFIKKAIQYRLPEESPIDRPAQLKPVNPEKGWLKERWKKDQVPTAKAAPYLAYKGDKNNAFWYFDKEMAGATEGYYVRERAKKEQYLGFIQDGQMLMFNEKSHARIIGKFQPEADGLTFHLKAVFTDTLRSVLSDDHAEGIPLIDRICGPVQKINDSTFTLRFYRMGLNNKKRTGDIWLLAKHSGDKNYKSTVQQFNMRIPHRLTEGQTQTIDFKKIDDQKNGIKELVLDAKASSGLPVCFYVKEGPAEVKSGNIVFAKIPPRSKYPVKVTVVAWQYGCMAEPRVQTAAPVERSFLIIKDEVEK